MELTTINPEVTLEPNSTWRDWVGIIASIGCAIHCAAMPLVIAYLPALGLSFLADESFHKWMALVCFLIAIVAFIPGIRKHGNWIPVSIASIGLAFITFAAFGLAGECCAGCDSSEANTAMVTSADANAECDTCDDCDSCVECNQDGVISITSANGEEKDMLAKFAPWITPLGGLILVSAHLLNRRFGCLCGCC
ncbi:MAG: MerC domain-containing protein [Mariniblastus sp.]|nr:MerC domain-containing protein [Mariniblastus sp.]